MADLFSQLQQYEKNQAQKFPTSGTIVGIDAGFVDVSTGTSILRNVRCVGTPTAAGQSAVLTWENGQPTAHITGGSSSGSSVALVRGPQGPEGPKGPAGPPGPQGDPGIVESPVELVELSSTPANPPAGSMLIYPKTDHKLYKLSSDGTETELGAGGSSGVKPGTTKLLGTNNSGAPDTQYDFSADFVALYSPATGQTILRSNTGTLTNNVLTAGPAANGRDQAGVFATNSWIHFYFIWNGTTLTTLSSVTPPPVGPTLPIGYTHWCYLGAIRFDGSGHLVRTYIRGNTALYQTSSSNDILPGGSATVDTAVSLAAFIPPNALEALIEVSAYFGSTTVLDRSDLTISIVPGVRVFRWFCMLQAGTGAGYVYVLNGEALLRLPNVNQNLYYRWVDGTVHAPARYAYISSEGYTMPNGG